MSQVDQYEFYKRRLAGETLPIHDGEPEAGFYRCKFRGGEHKPLAYWYGKDGGLRCLRGRVEKNKGEMLDGQKAREIWPHASKHPISKETYDAVARRGEPWPDQSELVTALSNNPPDEHSPDAMREAIADLAREIERMGEPTSQERADQLGDLKNKLGEMEGTADKARTTEKAQHLAACRDVDDKWRGVICLASAAKKKASVFLTPWLRKKADEAKAAQAAAVQAGKDPAVVAQPRTTAGTRGRSVGLRPVTLAQIDDYAAALAYFAQHPDVRDLVQRLANATAKTGVAAPGTTIIKTDQAA